MMGKSKSE